MISCDTHGPTEASTMLTSTKSKGKMQLLLGLQYHNRLSDFMKGPIRMQMSAHDRRCSWL